MSQEYRKPINLYWQEIAKKRQNASHNSWFFLSNLLCDVKLTHNYHLYRAYSDLFLAILDFLPEGSNSLEKFRSKIVQEKDKPIDFEDFPQISQQALAQQPLKGIQTLEIGGPFGQLLHALGAEVYCIDPDIEGESEFRDVNWRYVPDFRKDLYHPIPERITKNNWQHLITPETFNLTYSCNVLSQDSGTSSDWRWYIERNFPSSRDIRVHLEEYRRVAKINEEAESLARNDIFEISAQATKPGGLLIHQGDAIEQLLPLSDQIGLEFIEERYTFIPNWSAAPLYIFKKV